MQHMLAQRSDLHYFHPHDMLIIKTEIVHQLRNHEQITGANESGGILLGHVYEDHNEITRITTPGKLDIIGRFFFVRSRLGAQLRINKAWEKSQGTLIYIGEWHTHSELNPKPSLQDKSMIENARGKTIMEIDFLYLIIVGQNNTLWVGKQTKDGLLDLKIKFTP